MEYLQILKYWTKYLGARVRCRLFEFLGMSRRFLEARSTMFCKDDK